ncbi:hypothetical protein, partial [Klebsiella pneumoniae]|uniref:hypothetical protein n=1 Tax=Klebsiella pneumoniae TaxID=573 RepID=UPI001C6F8B5B
FALQTATCVEYVLSFKDVLLSSKNIVWVMLLQVSMIFLPSIVSKKTDTLLMFVKLLSTYTSHFPIVLYLYNTLLFSSYLM